MLKRHVSLLVMAGVAIAVFAGAAVPASGSVTCAGCRPWWHLTSQSIPRNLPPGGEGRIEVLAQNLGDGELSLASSVVLRDKLPAGLTAQSVSIVPGAGAEQFLFFGEVFCPGLPANEVVCTIPGALAEAFPGYARAYSDLELYIGVTVAKTAKTGEVDEVSVSGGGAPGVSLVKPIVVDPAPTPFGIEDYELRAENADGSIDTQAGSHPFQLTTAFELNQTSDERTPPAAVKDLRFKLPPGLVGNPTPFPQCPLSKFTSIDPNASQPINECPADTAVGVVSVSLGLTGVAGGAENLVTVEQPLFSLVPTTGEPARFGFLVVRAPVYLDTAVRTGGDYGVTVTTPNISEVPGLASTRLTFWGVPGDPRHDPVRGWDCVFLIGECNPTGQTSPPPFLTMPTSCSGPPVSTMEADSWQQEKVFTSMPYTFLDGLGRAVGMDGCNQLPFSPSISVAPDGQAGSTPSGLTVGVHVPQDVSLNSTGLAEAQVKDTTVTLPAGVTLNPAAADGLQACSEAQVGLSVDALPSCPEASKVATLEIRSPLLPNPLTGEAYLAQQNANPFGSLVALYLVAQDPVSGTLVKLAGEVRPDPVTGQLVSTFKNTPQLPFEDLKLHFFGGDRAPLASPGLCGAYTTTAAIAPWSGNEAATPSSTFEVLSGPNGSACRNPLPFNPSLTAGTTSIQAGGFSPFTMTMSRPDGSQSLQAVRLRMPPGLLGTLASVKLCPEAQANAGTCGPESLIGHTTVSVGVGGDPYSVTGGQVFITEGYKGAPYGLSIVNPAKAGPFDLGKVVVRAKVEVDPLTAVLTITTDTSGPYKIPTILDGIPLQIQHINVAVDRPGFTFNPTNCSPLAIAGSLTSDQGALSSLSVPFQVTNCAVLGFTPKFSVSTSAKTSKANGASLTAKLSYPNAPWGTQADIARVKVDLPKQLPSRLTTLQKACTSAQFAANPAGCPAASRIGTAMVRTPVLPVPLTGPVIFVSHGGEAFPSLTMVLQGYGVTVDLVGTTFISKAGITSTTFKTVPDVPFNTFELNLPEGKYSALTANGSLCAQKLVMPTEFVAQNGAEIHQNTPISVNGCGRARSLTRAQKLARALRVCEKDKVRGRRVACEHQARRKYGPVKKKRRQ